jgi:hypothetical protein
MGRLRDEAMVEVWGKVPEYKGRGRPPTKKRPKQVVNTYRWSSGEKMVE